MKGIQAIMKIRRCVAAPISISMAQKAMAAQADYNRAKRATN